MVQIFVSYSRSDRLFLNEFIPLINRVYGKSNVWYDDEIHGGADWWQTILDEIRNCDVFVFLVSNDSLESEYCQKELREALRLQKQILPVVARRLNPPYPGNIADDLADDLKRTQFVDLSGGFEKDEMSKVYAAINRLMSEKPAQPPTPRASQPTTEPRVEDKPSPSETAPISTAETPPTREQGSWWSRLSEGQGLVIAAMIGLIGVVGAAIISSSNQQPVVTPTDVVVAATETATPTDDPTPTDEPTETSTPTDKPSATSTPTDDPTATDEPTSTPTETVDPDAAASATAEQLVLSNQQTVEAILTGTAAATVRPSVTRTPPPTATPNAANFITVDYNPPEIWSLAGARLSEDADLNTLAADHARYLGNLPLIQEVDYEVFEGCVDDPLPDSCFRRQVSTSGYSGEVVLLVIAADDDVRLADLITAVEEREVDLTQYTDYGFATRQITAGRLYVVLLVGR